MCVKLSYATGSLQILVQTIHSLHQAWESLLPFVRGSAVKTDSPVAMLKKLEMIQGTNQLSVAPALTVDRFLTVVQRALKLEHNFPSR